MREERPETLLRSALEKIVYFEARSEQLSNDLASARAESDRLKTDLAQAAQREIELRRRVAELEVKLKRAHAEREELGRVNEAMRKDRAALIGKLVEASRIHGNASQDGEADFDLASFISELRSEAIVAREQQAAPRPVPMPKPTPQAPAAAPPSAAAATMVEHAQRFQAEGRLQISAENLSELSSATGFRGQTEETLFGFSVRELSSPDAQARARAAERLKSLGAKAGAAPLAAALHAETEPSIRVVLLNAFAALASSEGATVVAPLLNAPEAEVRIAALKALIALDPGQAGPHLTAAMKDPDRSVRRRASLMALGLPEKSALHLGAQAMSDADSEVRSLAVLVLGASGGERAKTILLPALADSERKVRRAAAEALSRMLGQDLSSIVDLDEVQRRREVRRLSALPLPPKEKAKTEPAKPTVAERTVKAVLSSPERPGGAGNVFDKVMTEVRAAIRGRSFDELEAALGQDQDAIRQACETLVASGQVVRRGAKYFVA